MVVNNSNANELNSYYVSGFVDGEGCFCISFSEKSTFSLGIEVRPSFSISQGKTSKDLMNKLAIFFRNPNKKAKKNENHDLGENIRPDRDTLKYETRELDNIANQVLPHFDKYPLQSNKQNDFVKF